MTIKNKVKIMLNIYKEKMQEANQWNQHSDGLRHEGSILVLETLLIYIKEEEAKTLIEEVKEEEIGMRADGRYSDSYDPIPYGERGSVYKQRGIK